MIFRQFLLIALVLLQLLSQAQLARLEGSVVDDRDAQPLPGATILIERGKGTVSSIDGTFGISAEPGTYLLRFQYIGYRGIVKEVTVHPGDTLHLIVRLEPEATQIDQVVVSAGRVEQRVAESTVSMTVLQPQQFHAAHITDSRELINRTPGVEVIDGQAAVRGGSGYSYGAGSRVLTLLDGLPILATDAGNIRWQFLPLENISQIEIIKGASSVLYGSSALNGVINIRTKRATEQGLTTFFHETAVFDSPPNPNWKWWGNSPRFSHAVSFSHLKKYNATEVGVGAYGLYDPGYRKRNHENIARANLNLRHPSARIPGLEYGLNTLAGYTDKSDFVLWENAETGALVQDESTAINLHSTFVAVDPFVGYQPSENQRHDLKMRFQMSDNTFPDSPQNESNALSWFSEYQSWYNLNALINLNAGLAQTTSRIQSPFYGNHSANNLAVYLQTDISPLQRLKLVGGVRMELNTLNSETESPIILLRTGLNYMATHFTFLRASFGQGYRYPSIAEKFAATSLGAVRIHPNIELQPESGWNAELGVKQGIRALNWDGMIDFAAFYNQNKDLIEYSLVFFDPVTGVVAPGFMAQNTEYSRVYGAETEFIFTRETGLTTQTIRGGYVYIFPVEFDPKTGKNKDTYLKYRRKHAAQIGLGVSYQKWDAGADLFYRSKFLNIDDVFLDPLTREDILPGFFDYRNQNNKGHFLADIHLGYQLTQGYRISLAIKNLANREYMGRPGDIRPHRRISIRLTGSL